MMFFSHRWKLEVSISHTRGLFLESLENSSARKASVKLQSAYSEKLIFLHVFNIKKTKRIEKFEGLEPWRCKGIKVIVAPEIGPKSFGTFEKQAPGQWSPSFSN